MAPLVVTIVVFATTIQITPTVTAVALRGISSAHSSVPVQTMKSTAVLLRPPRRKYTLGTVRRGSAWCHYSPDQTATRQTILTLAAGGGRRTVHARLDLAPPPPDPELQPPLLLLLLRLLLAGGPPVDHPGVVQGLEPRLVVQRHALGDVLAQLGAVVQLAPAVLDLGPDQVVDHLRTRTRACSKINTSPAPSRPFCTSASHQAIGELKPAGRRRLASALGPTKLLRRYFIVCIEGARWPFDGRVVVYSPPLLVGGPAYRNASGGPSRGCVSEDVEIAGFSPRDEGKNKRSLKPIFVHGLEVTGHRTQNVCRFGRSPRMKISSEWCRRFTVSNLRAQNRH